MAFALYLWPKENMSVRVRFAPSPTGPLHIGGVRTALYNYLFAKKNKGAFILRIEDTDQKRYVESAEKYIHDALDWIGISPDESPMGSGGFGPYRQSERKALYISNMRSLLEKNKAYLAFDSAEELSELREACEKRGETFIYNWKNRNSLKNSLSLSADKIQELIENGVPYVVRFNAFCEGDDPVIQLHDVVRGNVAVDASLLDDKVLVKQDGMPTYHLANVVDDHLMEISHVIRGEEWLPSLALHVLLYKAFGWNPPVFAHVPLILKPAGKGKLSKRDGAKLGIPVFPLNWDNETIGFKESGYLSPALVNYLALLGWNPGGKKEIFSLEELSKEFSLENINKAGGRFDIERCNWFNQQHIQALPPSHLIGVLNDELTKRCVEKNGVDLKSVVGLVQNRLVLLSDLWEEAGFFFSAPEKYDLAAVKKQWKDETPEILGRISILIGQSKFKTADDLSNIVKSWASEKSIRLGMIMAPLRIALVGSLRGPDVFEICAAVGAETCIERIKRALDRIP